MANKGGAQPGNRNNVKGKRFTDAIKRAIAQGDPDRLRRIAEKLLDMAEQGDMDAIKHLGDRLDGKPRQETELTGDVIQRVVGGEPISAEEWAKQHAE